MNDELDTFYSAQMEYIDAQEAMLDIGDAYEIKWSVCNEPEKWAPARWIPMNSDASIRLLDKWKRDEQNSDLRKTFGVQDMGESPSQSAAATTRNRKPDGDKRDHESAGSSDVRTPDSASAVPYLYRQSSRDALVRWLNPACGEW